LNTDEASVNAAMDNLSPEDMQQAMKSMDSLLDSNVIGFNFLFFICAQSFRKSWKRFLFI
jgi:hypothetical protein